MAEPNMIDSYGIKTGWGTTADPLPSGWDDFEKALSEGGYTQCHSFGEENNFKIEGYWNGGKENFLITICDFQHLAPRTVTQPAFLYGVPPTVFTY